MLNFFSEPQWQLFHQGSHIEISPNAVYTANSAGLSVWLTEQGVGIALLPELLVKNPKP